MQISHLVSALATTAFLAATTQAAEPEQQTIGQTLMLKGKVISPVKEGVARFAITDVTWGQKISLLGAHYVAIIFDGNANPNRICPYYKGRKSDIVETNAGDTYLVTTRADDAEIKHVKETGCMITDSPDISSIRKALPEEIPDYSLH